MAFWSPYVFVNFTEFSITKLPRRLANDRPMCPNAKTIASTSASTTWLLPLTTAALSSSTHVSKFLSTTVTDTTITITITLSSTDYATLRVEVTGTWISRQPRAHGVRAVWALWPVCFRSPASLFVIHQWHYLQFTQLPGCQLVELVGWRVFTGSLTFGQTRRSIR